MVNVNGLRAIAELARTNPTLDLSSVRMAVDRLAKSDLVEVKEKAIDIRQALENRKTNRPVENPH
jgi:hypothetical protein